MPEIAEVARVVHFLRLHLTGKRIANATALDDGNVFGKVGTSGSEVESSIKGKKASWKNWNRRAVVTAGSQGKYFWITFDKPPHLVMHLGMTGWMHIKGEATAYTNYQKRMKEEEIEQWPPKFWKFHFTTDSKPEVSVAFTDARRFGRVRLVHCPGADIRKHSPLVENGPDPVVDKDIFTEEYLHKRMRSRHVPVKALLLDQAMISGIGNWVADETLYHAKLHPEQYCDDFDDEQIKQLHTSIRHVCQTAVDKLGDSDQFPEDWLFNYRWAKAGKASPAKLPNGEKLAFITVGGRTSCYAPNLQKKTGRVVPNAKEVPIDATEATKKSAKPKKKQSDIKKEEEEEEEKEEEEKPKPSKRKSQVDSRNGDHKSKKVKEEMIEEPQGGRRRSGRLKK